MANIKSLAGARFGRLLVTDKGHSKKAKSGTRLYWKCVCDCGAQIETEGASLRSGKSLSCGCWQRERASETGRSNRIHGYHNTPTYKSWLAMLSRCLYKGNAAYPRYGGSGITVCDRWRESFQAFLSDVGERPSLGHTIDRYPNNGGNYEPGNCRWATWHEQATNRRKRRPKLKSLEN